MARRSHRNSEVLIEFVSASMHTASRGQLLPRFPAG